MEQLRRVASRDGTSIGYLPTGTGPPLVLVHGSPADHSTFELLIPHLEPWVTVCAMDRRGRGMSGDGPSYAHEWEFEDVAAVVDALGPDTAVFGHSYGAVVALEAARLTTNLRRLVLYEPWIGRYPDGLINELQQLASSGDREAVVTTIFRRLLGMTDAELDRYRAHPSWRSRVALAEVNVREATAEDAYEFDHQRLADVRVPTLLLVGGDSPPDMRATIDMVHDALPNSTIDEIPGQQHLAHRMAPELLASRIIEFVE
ncbi:MAG TPA: alpha/beta hydrolase [Nitriliruptorales bacterium]|nr:alpha/beta hydrolase [Nitriliruptorales bacterium]